MSNRSGTIVTIEDDAAVRRSIADYLEYHGWEVLEAENGRAGLEVCRRNAPDLILLDLRLPEMDGLEVMAHLNREHPDTPVIVVSGTGAIADAIEALRLGAWDYLIKPLPNMSVLLHAVQKALERASLIRENRAYQEHLEQEVARRTEALSRANEEMRQLNTRLRRLVESTRRITVFSRVSQFGVRLLEEFGAHMQADGGSLYLAEAEGLRLVHTLDPPHAPAFLPYPLVEGSILNRALRSGLPVLIPDLHQSREWSLSGWTGYRNGSVLVLPLIDETARPAAVLALHDKSSPPFTDQDREIGSILASYSSEALRATRASEALREAHDRLEVRVEERTADLVRSNEQLQHEIEQRKRLQKTVMHQEKLKTLGAIAAEVAHEVRNPLVSIGGFAKRLKKRNPDLRECDIILSEAVRLEKILARIRHYLSPVELHPTACDVNPIIVDTAALLSPETKKRRVVCRLDLGEDLSPVHADPDILAQIFINLIRNATEVMQKGGTLVVRSYETDQDVQVEFRNPRQGLKIRNPDALFMPFADGGNSFGLPLCHRLLKDMGGLLTFVEDGDFLVFTVSIPKAAGERDPLLSNS